jgi:hypothetical protein
MNALGVNACYVAYSSLADSADDPATETTDAVRFGNAADAVGELVIKHVLKDEFIDFVYLFIPFLPFGERSSRFKVGECGATVRLIYSKHAFF